MARQIRPRHGRPQRRGRRHVARLLGHDLSVHRLRWIRGRLAGPVCRHRCRIDFGGNGVFRRLGWRISFPSLQGRLPADRRGRRLQIGAKRRRHPVEQSGRQQHQGRHDRGGGRDDLQRVPHPLEQSRRVSEDARHPRLPEMGRDAEHLALLSDPEPRDLHRGRRHAGLLLLLGKSRSRHESPERFPGSPRHGQDQRGALELGRRRRAVRGALQSPRLCPRHLQLHAQRSRHQQLVQLSVQHSFAAG